jgi:hypothetical protein
MKFSAPTPTVQEEYQDGGTSNQITGVRVCFGVHATLARLPVSCRRRSLIAHNHKLSERDLVPPSPTGAAPTDVRIHQVAAATDPEDTSEAMT